MSTPYDSHKISFSTPPISGGKDLHISLLLKLTCIIALLMATLASVAYPAVTTPYSDTQRIDAFQSSEPDILADSTQIYFRQSSSELDFDFEGNGERLKTLLDQIEKITGQDSIFVLSTLRVIGSSSTEGSEDINRKLSEERAHTLFDYFAKHIVLPDSITDFEYLGRNWKGLYNLVASDPAVPSQTEVLSLLRKVITTPTISSAESNRLHHQLKNLKGGIPYNYIYRHIFPALRYSHLYVDYKKRADTKLEPIALQVNEPEEKQLAQKEIFKEAEQIEEPVIKVRPQKHFYMDLRSNMLFDIAAVPNIGAEFYLGKNFSILANWMYGWWDNNARHRYWRIYGGELGARWWFGRKAHAKPLTGHHLGIYGGVLTFDFEWGGTGYMGGKPGGTLWDRCLVNAGIEYGYSLPIGKHLNIDFSLGVGYLGGKYIKYFPFSGAYYTEKIYKMRFFGPTKAEISLVWLLGRGNTNNRKGGEE